MNYFSILRLRFKIFYNRFKLHYFGLKQRYLARRVDQLSFRISKLVGQERNPLILDLPGCKGAEYVANDVNHGKNISSANVKAHNPTNRKGRHDN